ncbi:ribonuclease Z [Sarracenia purpurea var. burkii]
MLEVSTVTNPNLVIVDSDGRAIIVVVLTVVVGGVLFVINNCGGGVKIPTVVVVVGDLPCADFGRLFVVEMETKTRSSKSDKKCSDVDSSLDSILKKCSKKKKRGMVIEGYPIDGLSIAGHETCIILPTLNLAFDIGWCPQRTISQQFLFISHGHMDHIVNSSDFFLLYGFFEYQDFGRLFVVEMETKTRSSKSDKKCSDADSSSDSILKKCSEKKRGMVIEGYPIDGLSIAGHETCIILPTLNLAFDIGRCPQRAISQQFLFISHGHMDHIEYIGLPGSEIKKLKSSGVEITYTVITPEIAFTGDTVSDFIVDDNNIDVLKAKVLIMESTYINNIETVENARDYGHTHLSEVEYLKSFMLLPFVKFLVNLVISPICILRCSNALML